MDSVQNIFSFDLTLFLNDWIGQSSAVPDLHSAQLRRVGNKWGYIPCLGSPHTELMGLVQLLVQIRAVLGLFHLPGIASVQQHFSHALFTTVMSLARPLCQRVEGGQKMASYASFIPARGSPILGEFPAGWIHQASNCSWSGAKNLMIRQQLSKYREFRLVMGTFQLKGKLLQMNPLGFVLFPVDCNWCSAHKTPLNPLKVGSPGPIFTRWGMHCRDDYLMEEMVILFLFIMV